MRLRETALVMRAIATVVVVLVVAGAFGCGEDTGFTQEERISEELSGAINTVVGVESEGAFAICDRRERNVFDCQAYRVGRRLVEVSYDVRVDTSGDWTARLDREASDDDPEVPDDPRDSAGFPEQVGGAAVSAAE
jgi:hypothetical protein